MLRIDADDYVVLYIRCDDHLHRYAVPAHFTVEQAACKVWDSFNFRKRTTQLFTLAEEGARPPIKNTRVDVAFGDNTRVHVLQMEKK